MSRRDEQILQHIPGLRRYARALLGDADRAEDLVQETLARALGKLHFWRRGSDMRAWLFTIMHHQFANDYRRARIRPDVIPMDAICVEPADGEMGYAVIGTQPASRLVTVASAVQAAFDNSAQQPGR